MSLCICCKHFDIDLSVSGCPTCGNDIDFTIDCLKKHFTLVDVDRFGIPASLREATKEHRDCADYEAAIDD